MARLSFLGAAGTVTGSKHLLEVAGRRILVDCGLFQGLKRLRQQNWRPLDIDPRRIDAVVLTHAHIDHTGYLPRLIRDGFDGPVWATPPTADLATILLRDAGYLQEEEAKYHNRKGTSKHHPAEPLYTAEEGQAAAARIIARPFYETFEIAPRVAVTFRPAGHILGSATVTVTVDDGAGGKRVVFSGDLGRRDAPLQRPPEPIGGEAEAVILESTYGDCLHPEISPLDSLEAVVHRAVERGGALIIPAFAVARTQSLLFLLASLERAGRIPVLPTFLDSPMAIDATELYRRHGDDLRPEIRRALETGQRPFSPSRLEISRTPDTSRAINGVEGPAVILSASGMATGGRILHHLKQRLPDPRTTVLISGYQAEGTRGARLQRGEPTLRIFGAEVSVRATVETLDGLSAHGDQKDLLDWLATSRHPPARTFLVHGELSSLDALSNAIEERYGWSVTVPIRGESVDLPF